MAPMAVDVWLGRAESAATIVGVLAAGAGIAFAAYQSFVVRSIAQGDFVLRLDEAMRRHDEIHRRLAAGEWREAAPTRDDRAQLQPYLGLFERVSLLVNSGLVSATEVDKLYGYRLDVVLWNTRVHGLAVSNPQGWGNYLALQRTIDELHASGQGRGRRLRRLQGLRSTQTDARVRR